MSKFSMGRSLKAVAVMAVATGALVSGQAQAISLADLISNNGTITVGDKLFSDFGYIATGFDNHATDPVSFWGGTPADYLAQAAFIEVVGETVAGNYGLKFIGDWHVHSGESASAQFSYKVTVTDPAYYLSDFHMYGAPSVTGAASVKVTESLGGVPSHDPIPVVPPSLLTIYDGLDLGTQLSDVAYTAAGVYPTSAFIETDIRLSAMVGGTANLGHVQQMFSQSPVPEPSTYAMALAGLAAMGLVVRRKNRTNA